MIEDFFHPLGDAETGARSHADYVGEPEFEVEVPEYTRSADAAIDLAELREMNVSQLLNDALEGHGGLWSRGFDPEGYAGQVALAMCRAIVRAVDDAREDDSGA